MHSVETLIANLQIDPEYYAKADLQVSLNKGHPMYRICTSATRSPRPRRHSWS